LPPQKDIFERLLAGETILPADPQIGRLKEEAFAVKELLIQMNNSSNPEEISEILSRILNKEIQDVTVFTPIYINYGKHINIGKNVFINFDCTFLALGGITIEDDVLIGPKVSLITENHPLNPQERNGLVGRPIHIKKNAWIGASATILPGVTIGKNAVIAAGAVVSKDVPDNTVVGGIPAKFIKTIQP
jgi:acetyltransferase-like isoleucine patch superfamily enzyme